MIRVKEARLAQVFEEWKRRFDADPDAFMSAADFEKNQPKSYGEAAARYFKWLDRELTDDRS